MNENSRTRYFLAAPVLASLTDQMFNLGGHIGKRLSGKHHQLSNAYINIITGQIYSEKITNDLLSFEETGNRVYKEFVDERLKPESTKSINEPIKKIMLQTCKSAIKAKIVKVNDKTKELGGNCNLFARCALIQWKRNIDMKVIIGDYELTVFPKSLFSSDGSLLDGSKLKFDAVTEILKATEVEPKDQLPTKPDCNESAERNKYKTFHNL